MDGALWWCRDRVLGSSNTVLEKRKRRGEYLFGACYLVDSSVPVLFHVLLKISYKMGIIPILQLKKRRAKNLGQVPKFTERNVGAAAEVMLYLLSPVVTILWQTPRWALELFSRRY